MNSCIFCEMGFLHIGQTSREEAQSAHVPCPHKKATLRRLSRQMAHMLASSISLTCACKDSSEWRVSRYFSSFSLNSGSCPAGAPAKKKITNVQKFFAREAVLVIYFSFIDSTFSEIERVAQSRKIIELTVVGREENPLTTPYFPCDGSLTL